MRCAIAGIGTESCTFSSVPTELTDFVVDRGPAMLHNGRYPFFEDADCEAIPLLRARALPGGPVTAEAYAILKQECLERLTAASPIDCVYLDMHGAMVVEGLEDAEQDWFQAIRTVVGPNCLIAASFDLHGNLTRAACDEINLLSAFRTAPHIDELATREKVFSMLKSCYENQLIPSIHHIRVPVLFSGERSSTLAEPARSLYGALPTYDQCPGILDASIFMGYPWADDARASASVALTGTNETTAANAAKDLARACWQKRREFRFGVPSGSMDWCIETAMEASESSVFISDSGDNPTAGAPGDVPFALERLLAHQITSAVVASITDAEAVRIAFATGLNTETLFSLGGKLDHKTSAPLAVCAKVLSLTKNDAIGGDCAVLDIHGTKVIITSKRCPFHFIKDFRRMGIDPLAHKIVIVKIGYLEPDLAASAPKALLALTPGCVDQDICRINYQRLRRPIFPLDPDMSAPTAFR